MGLNWWAVAILAVASVISVPQEARPAPQNAVFEGYGRSPEYDPGGSPVEALMRIIEAQRRGEEVAIRGVCSSSCALKLSAGRNLCVSPTAEIGVHEVRQTPVPWSYAAGTRDNLWTGFFQGMLPACARDLFNARQGFASGRLAVVSGGEILRACPTIRACTR